MNCTEFETLLADFLDGALADERKSEFHGHQASCAACSGLARDAAAAMAFLDRVPAVVAPPAMVSRILIATSGPAGRSWLRFRQWLGVAWQPQFAMGALMALLSLAIAARSWNGASNGVQRAWERTVTSYENMPMLSEVQYQLREWVNDRNDRADGRGGENR